VTKEKTPVPPFLRGARGDLDLIVKQQSMTGFDLKLTPMGSWSVPTILFWVGTKAKPSPNYIVQPELILHELETIRGKAALNHSNLVGSTSQIDGVTNNIVVRETPM
jgi:hypothetical protein